MSKIKAIVGGNIVLERGIIWDGTLIICDDTILYFGSKEKIEIPEGAEIIDAGGAYVGPGFVDIHSHAGDDKCICFETEKAAEFFLRHGTTTLLATVDYGFDFDKFLGAIRAVKETMKNTKNVKGLNLEGPYINPEYGSFAHLNPWRAPINPAEYKVLVDEAGTLAKIWSVAPEREGIYPFLEYARKVAPEVVFSVGHSEATPEQIRKMGKYRPTLQTHSMCATGRLPVAHGTRGYGPDEYCFKEPDVFCELICDSCGAHVNSDMQQLLIHNKGIERVVLITDCTPAEPVAAPPAELAHVEDLNFDDKGIIAGSRLSMDKVCRNIMTHTNCGIAQAFVMAALNPAKVIGMDDKIGSIEEGKIADFVFVDDRFNVKKVMVSGDVCNF